MKLTSLLPILLILSSVACKKGSSLKPSVFLPATLTSIQGKWELRKVNGNYIADYPAGNGNTLKFTGSSYERHDSLNGTASERSGTFTLITDSIPAETQCAPVRTGQVTRIVYDDNLTAPFEIPEITGNTLKISANNCPALDDYSEVTYVKIAE